MDGWKEFLPAFFGVIAAAAAMIVAIIVVFAIGDTSNAWILLVIATLVGVSAGLGVAAAVRRRSRRRD